MYFEFFLASELGMTVNRLRHELTEEEFLYWSAYYEVKAKRDKEEFLTLENSFSAYDLFMRCMHANGISYDIIKKQTLFKEI